MIPYYLLKVDRIDESLNKISSYTQIGIDGIKDNEPSVILKKKDTQIINNFIKYDVICEIQHKHKGRAYGVEEIFERFILIHEKTLYYNANNNLIILSASKDVFSQFIKKFSLANNAHLKITKTQVDFQYIINNQYSKGLKGVWLGDYPDININSMYLMGNKIENSTQYKQLIDKGATIKNLTILYNYNNVTEKIMITKDGGIILYRQMDENDFLPLLIDIYNKLIVTIF